MGCTLSRDASIELVPSENQQQFPTLVKCTSCPALKFDDPSKGHTHSSTKEDPFKLAGIVVVSLNQKLDDDVEPEKAHKQESWGNARIEIHDGHIIIMKETFDSLESATVKIDLSLRPDVDVLRHIDEEKQLEEKSEKVIYYILEVKLPDRTLRVKTQLEDTARIWVAYLRHEMLKVFIKKFQTIVDSENSDQLPSERVSEKQSQKRSQLTPPVMNIVILVVGTRGDVQPFVYLGQALKRDGHRVRLATHAEYREDVVAKGGLEFFPLGGDPRKLSEFMVKTEGRLIPDITSAEERQSLPEKMRMLRDIVFSTFPACTQPDPEDAKQTPFSADAIISNPVTYGHIHCAEALAVPLHIMFPQPWSPTKCFPHPLSNLALTSRWSLRNYYSYMMVDEIMWIGLGSIINDFRKHVLKLHAIRPGQRGHALLNDNKVPISHMWSPSFVPKCVDWPEYVDVVGEFRSMSGAPSTFVPPAALVEFLEAGEKPLYMGFGSMVIGDPTRLVNLVRDAADKIGCRLLLQSGWTKYGEDNSLISNRVMVIGAMPHDWLLYQVSGVVHHGGAGTTSAGLRAGNPTFVCPFFGDQHFWAEMVNRAGVGPKGCPIVDLTLEKLIEALQTLRDPETIKRARDLGEKMNSEDGVAQGVDSFYRNLPLSTMLCEVSVFNNLQSKIAKVYCPLCGLKMCEEVDAVVHRQRIGIGDRSHHERVPFRAVRYEVMNTYRVLQEIGQGIGAAAVDIMKRPIEVVKEKGKIYAMDSLASSVTGSSKSMAPNQEVVVSKPTPSATADAARRGSRSAKVESNLMESGQPRRRRSFALAEAGPASSPGARRASEVPSQHILLHRDDSVEVMSEMERTVEEAYSHAWEAMCWWKEVDKDGNRTLDLKEMENFFRADANAIFLAADADGDNVVTFTEFIWKFRSTFVDRKSTFARSDHLLA